MIHQLTNFLTNKGYKLRQAADCYQVTTPSNKTALANLRWKTRPVWGRAAKRWEWSIPLQQWQRYLAMGVQFLFVLETSTNTIHAAAIKTVLPEARVYSGDDLDKGGTVFLPVSAYHQVGRI